MLDTIIPVKVRTARKQHVCDRYPPCDTPIEPGEQYELHTAAPWSDGNESERWITHKVHRGEYGIGCAEAAAYRENAERNDRA